MRIQTIRLCFAAGILLLFLASVFPVAGQNKVAAETRRDKEKRIAKDPWADREDEIDSIVRWDFGLNLGAYFADKYPANFYNGTPGNVNNVNYVMANRYWYQEIKNLLGASDTVLVSGYPLDMKYKVAFTGGIFIRFNFNRKNGIFLEANYTQLKAGDIITFEVDPPPYPTFQDIRSESLAGKEGRVLISLGYQRSFPLPSKVYLFLQAGGMMCYTQVRKSVLVVEGHEYNLVNVYGTQGYIPNTNAQTYNINQNAFGFGVLAGAGAGFPLTNLFGLEPGFSAQYYPVNLQGYPGFSLSFAATLRVLLGVGHMR